MMLFAMLWNRPKEVVVQADIHRQMDADNSELQEQLMQRLDTFFYGRHSNVVVKKTMVLEMEEEPTVDTSLLVAAVMDNDDSVVSMANTSDSESTACSSAVITEMVEPTAEVVCADKVDVEEDVTQHDSDNDDDPGRTRLVQFHPETTVMSVPSHRDYDENDKQRVWSSIHEVEVNAQRNTYEFQADGAVWSRVLEEDSFVEMNGELVHPETYKRRTELLAQLLAQQQQQQAEAEEAELLRQEQLLQQQLLHQEKQQQQQQQQQQQKDHEEGRAKEKDSTKPKKKNKKKSPQKSRSPSDSPPRGDNNKHTRRIGARNQQPTTSAPSLFRFADT